MSFDKLFTSIETKILNHRTSNEIQCLGYLKELKEIIDTQKQLFIIKKGSATFKKISALERKINSLLDFHQHDTFAGSYLLIQIYAQKLTVDDILYTIVAPKNSEEKTKEAIRARCAKAFNIVSQICEYATIIKEDNKLTELIKKLGLTSTKDAIEYANKLNKSINEVDLATALKEETD